MNSPLLAILLAVIASSAIGALWYSPVLFGTVWQKAMGFTSPVTEEERKKGMNAMLANTVTTVITMIGLYGLVGLLTGSLTCPYDTIACGPLNAGMPVGIYAGIIVWTFFVLPTVLQSVFFEKKTWFVAGINLGYRLVELVVAGAIIGAVI